MAEQHRCQYKAGFRIEPPMVHGFREDFPRAGGEIDGQAVV